MNSATPRWNHTCAWDGHELGEMEYVQISAHERVCLDHHPQFLTWLRDKSKTIYRVVPEDELPARAKRERRLDRVLKLLQTKPQGSSQSRRDSRSPGRKRGRR